MSTAVLQKSDLIIDLMKIYLWVDPPRNTVYEIAFQTATLREQQCGLVFEGLSLWLSVFEFLHRSLVFLGQLTECGAAGAIGGNALRRATEESSRATAHVRPLSTEASAVSGPTSGIRRATKTTVQVK